MTKKSSKKRKIGLDNPLVVIILTTFAILSILSLKKTNEKAVISKKNIEKLEENIVLLEEELAAEKEELKDSENEIYKEKIIRNELLQKKEGEIVLQIPDVKEEENNQNPDSKEEEKLNAWKKLIF